MSQFKGYPKRKWLLKLTNYNYLLENFQTEISYYKAAHKLLADLEAKIEFEDKLEEIVLIPYKEDGDAIFILKGTKRLPYANIVSALYEFSTTVS